MNWHSPESYLAHGRASDDRPDLHQLLAANDDARGELPPGVAVAACCAAWFEEHWPAIVLGFAAGLLAVSAALVGGFWLRFGAFPWGAP